MRCWEEKWASDGLYSIGGRAKKWPERQSVCPFKVFRILTNSRKDQRKKKILEKGSEIFQNRFQRF
jgi:hypothetical protein